MTGENTAKEAAAGMAHKILEPDDDKLRSVANYLNILDE